MTTAAASGSVMRFAVDGWDPGYGTAFDVDDELTEAAADVQPEVERPTKDWRPVGPTSTAVPPSRMLFVDGVRRIDARAWIDDAPDLLTTNPGPAATASEAICASYAAGVVCCTGTRAHLLPGSVSMRGLFTIARHALAIRSPAGDYEAHVAERTPQQPLAAALSRALQNRLAGIELEVAVGARAQAPDQEDDLLVVDGPLAGRTSLPRAIGYIKSHHRAYLSADLHAMVGRLQACERTPVFRIGDGWARFSWYLRLPGSPGAPWAGVVRIECSPDLPLADVTALADRTQLVLPRYASADYKDTRAPQNLYPIAGLERELRRRLGDQRLLYRALRVAAAA